ncbi:MAG TPA: glycosyltransferase family 4 protein [Bryobacteraceae bacterium]|nr:glycosyltransferase family 4 protein [Bryobacteraceae bacterium]
MSSSLRAAFLLSQHPAINHAFLLREIRQMRALGFEIHTASIRAADRPAKDLTPEERDEQLQTFYVKPLGLAGILPYHLSTIASRPLAYFTGLFYAISLSRWNIKKAFSLLMYFAEAIVVGRWMQKKNLVHLHAQYSSTVGLLARRVFPIELSISFHGPDEFNDPAGFWLKEKIAASSFVRAISCYARGQLMKVCSYREWSKIELAYLGIDPTAFRPRPFRPAPAPFELLCVGRLASVKAQHILLAAVEELVRRGKHVLLHLAGGGPDRQSLEQDIAARGIQSQVILHGWVSQADLDALYLRADAFVLASFAEGLPGVLMEAMAMEIPCVSTWITGVPELIRNEVEGLLTAPSDAQAIADAIARLIDDPDLRLRLGRASRERILQQFDLRRNAATLAAIFARRLIPAADPIRHQAAVRQGAGSAGLTASSEMTRS